MLTFLEDKGNLLGTKEIHKHNSQDISGKFRENPGTMAGKSCLCVCVFPFTVFSFRETLCESGRWIGALKKRGRVLKKRVRVLKKRGRFLRRGVLARGTGGGLLLQNGGGS